MKFGNCECGNRIYFGNSLCLRCGRLVGCCNQCSSLSSFTRLNDFAYQCDHTECRARVERCRNQQLGLCTVFIGAQNPQMEPGEEPNDCLCDWCSLTIEHPDSAEPDTLLLWTKLERAKQRFLGQLEAVELPPYSCNSDWNKPIRFRFPEDVIAPDGSVLPAITGHLNGIISVRLKEADSVLREENRVHFNEPHRSLIGHLRHEYGHYLDWATLPTLDAAAQSFESSGPRIDFIGGPKLHRGRDQSSYIRLFGDPNQIPYEDAKNRYYADGPVANWESEFVSAYASMHPWEDFAETTALYLEILSVCCNAYHFQWTGIDVRPSVPIAAILTEAHEISCFVSECNLDVGLSVILPRVINEKVCQKLDYIHQLRLLNDRSDPPIREVVSNLETAQSNPCSPA